VLNERAIEELVERERRNKPERCKLREVGSHDNEHDDPPAA
jgi:hypothetical protein